MFLQYYSLIVHVLLDMCKSWILTRDCCLNTGSQDFILLCYKELTVATLRYSQQQNEVQPPSFFPDSSVFPDTSYKFCGLWTIPLLHIPPHLSFYHVYCSFSGPPTKTPNRSFNMFKMVTYVVLCTEPLTCLLYSPAQFSVTCSTLFQQLWMHWCFVHCCCFFLWAC